MTNFVVDTNLAVVANGEASTVSVDCRLSAVSALERVIDRGRVILDRGGDIQDEYRRHLRPSGQPGVGDRFYHVVLTVGHKVRYIDLPRHDSERLYVDFPADSTLKKFHRKDRKFAAASRKAKVPVLCCVDSDWVHHKTNLEKHGVKITFVCGSDMTAWFN